MTTTKPYAHLHCHSHYSLLDGASRIPELVSQVKRLNMNAVALTDHGNLYGAIELYREAKSAGIRPIIGYEAYVAPGKRTDREAKGMSEASYHLTLLAYNNTGFRNLIKMSSLAFLEGFYYRPRIDKTLLEQHAEGLICLSGCLSSEFSQFLIKEQMEEAEALAGWFAKLFGEHFYIELQNNGLDLQTQTSAKAADLAKRMGIPTVATCDAHYLCRADAEMHDVLLCINTGKQRSDANRMKYGSDQFYLRSPQEMYQLFQGQEDAVERSQKIAEQCEVVLDFKKRHFPVFTPPKKKKPDVFLHELCQAGLQERYGEHPSAAAQERLEHELKVIDRLGFSSYFLIVWDFCRFAREQGFPYGARGSACGSIVSYVLKLSHVDPLEYGLLFERFLDPNRAEAPDIDIDFCQDRRDEVIRYVKQLYGEGSVAQIATFGTMAARAAIKNVGRALGFDFDRVNQISNLIPKQPLGISIQEAMEMVPDLKHQHQRDPQVRELIDIAMKLEGTNANVGKHAAGVVIADGPITDYVPVQKIADKADALRQKEEGSPAEQTGITTQWTMEDLEKVGMLKMDFLGLRTLTLLDKAVALIKQTRGIEINLDALPLDDADTYLLLSSGKTQGVFQFESEGIRNLLRSLKPDNIRDIIACTALYRPGPLQGGMVDAYINRKHGREQPVYEHELMEKILKETHGVMVYQEQVMMILNALGDIELSSAYACIKAISKKKHEIINQRKDEFIAGAKQRGVAEEVARKIFELIEFFGGYGFNKSHSTAYAYVSYQTAYLKAHYPAEFMAAVLTSELGDNEKMAEHVRNTKELGITILPPDVNESHAEFSVPGPNQVRFGLAALRGFGKKAAESVVQERLQNGRYKDLYNLCERLDQRLVTRAALETLIKAGALDSLAEGQRAALMMALPGALQAGSMIQEDRRRGQRHMFDLFDESSSDEMPEAQQRLPSTIPWTRLEQLTAEKEALGFFLSSHPLADHEAVIQSYSSHSLSQLANLGANQEVFIGGMIVGLRLTHAKRSRSGETRMARFKLEDLGQSVECVMFPDDFTRNKEMLKDDLICFVRANVDRTREQPGLIVSRLVTLQDAQNEQTRGLILRLSMRRHDERLMGQLAHVLRNTPGRCPVYLDVADEGGRHAHLRVGDRYYIDPARVDRHRLEMLLGAGSVEFLGPNGRMDGSGHANGRHG